MANQKGNKYGFTALFPIKPGEHAAQLRTYLRSLDSCLYGSPLSGVPIIHMARFVIIDQMPYQGIPAKKDMLSSAYLLFLCEFDGSSSDLLVQQLVQEIPNEVTMIWQHCRAFPGNDRVDVLADYFSRCQLETTLFLADRPVESVQDVLRALLYKRALSEIVLWAQQQGTALDPSDLKTRSQALRNIDTSPAPHPGSL
jgi:hypothetical protein